MPRPPNLGSLMSLTVGSQEVLARARIALDTCRTIYAPDDRTSCFDLRVDSASDRQRLILRGAVETERLLRLARSKVRDVTGYPVTTREVTVIESHQRSRTVTVTALPIRARPAADAEQVTQALVGDSLESYDEDGEWTRVRAPDGYLGWVETDSLVDADPIEVDAVVSERPNDDSPLVPGVECKVLDADDPSRIELRTGDRYTVPATAVCQRADSTSLADVIAVARSFLGTPYEWGGKTTRGIDCSGLVWVAYHVAGVRLPRDADQQRQVGTTVDRDDLSPGDLLFFPGHVAISLGGAEYIHAYGSAEEVTTNSLDPTAADYIAALDSDFTTARRVMDGVAH